MPQTRRKTQMNSPHRNQYVTPLLGLMLLALSGCAQMPNAEPPLIARKPKPTPLPAAILQIDTQPSTRTLSEGQEWLQDSERILDAETPK